MFLRGPIYFFIFSSSLCPIITALLYSRFALCPGLARCIRIFQFGFLFTFTFLVFFFCFYSIFFSACFFCFQNAPSCFTFHVLRLDNRHQTTLLYYITTALLLLHPRSCGVTGELECSLLGKYLESGKGNGERRHRYSRSIGFLAGMCYVVLCLLSVFYPVWICSG